MKKLICISAAVFYGVFLSFVIFAQAGELPPIEPFSNKDRVLVLAPHPDDENIGCGGVIQRAVKSGAKVKIIYLTNGDHNEFAFIVFKKRLIIFNSEFVAMGKVREEEAKKAMKILGVDESNLIFLGYPDYGTNNMFFSAWETNAPFKDMLTRQSYVPYKEAPSYGAPYKSEQILFDLKSILLDYKPTKIFVSHPADVNGDHWAYYCFLQIALQDLKKEIPEPKLYVYFVHGPGWPSPRHYHPELGLEPSAKHFPDALINWSTFKLTEDEIDKKYQAMLSYRSQTCVSAFYLLSFVRQNELFGDYPTITLNRQKSTLLKGGDAFNSDKRVSYAVVDDYLWVRVRKPQELRYRLFFRFYFFGYNDDVLFNKMPNIGVRTKKDRVVVEDMNLKKRLDPQGTSAQLSGEYFTLKVPLKLLGEPDFLLTCVITDKTFLPLDSAGFRKVRILEEK
ncbi:MAG: PIG-L family deacetylase [Candidatus Omnitrophica bacterium]|nr:PIG-L family deacetylase [Candidatus Omnitrophota bacterium]